MNRKQFTILLVLVIVLGGAGLYLRKRQTASWEGANPSLGKKLLGDLPMNDVAHIVLKQGTNEVNLAKKDDLWRVRERNDYPANYSEISDFLIKVHDLKAVQSEKVGPSQLPKLGLVAGQGTNAALVVDFNNANDKTVKSLLLGKKHMRKSERPSPYGMGDEGWPDGRYVKVGSNSDEVDLISDALSNIEPTPANWLNKDFFRVEKMRSVAVTFPATTNSWKLARETENGELKLVDAKPGEQIDSSKVSGVSNPLGSPSFNDVAANAKPDQFGLDKPTVVTLDTFDNFSYTVNVGQKTNDVYPMTVSVSADISKERTPGKDEKADDKTKLDKEFKEKQTKLQEKLTQEKAYGKWIYLVSSWTLDPLLKERSQLMVEKKDEKKDDKKEKSAASAESTTKPDEPLGDPLDPKPEGK